MPKIQLASDIHLEFWSLPLLNNAGADVLILAGDIMMAKHKNNLERSIHYHKFFEHVAKQFDYIIYVPGNHEHYSNLYNNTEEDLKEFLTMYPHIYVLNDNSVEIDGTLYIGSTLWTDFHGGNPMVKFTVEQGMNDYHCIKYKDNKGNYRKFRAQDAHTIHNLSVNYIVTTARKHTGPVVVVTHHGPFYDSIHETYKNDYAMNGGFSSNLEHIIQDLPNVKLWCHGHTHHAFDYQKENIRVVCNPHGYPNEGAPFNPSLVLDIS